MLVVYLLLYIIISLSLSLSSLDHFQSPSHVRYKMSSFVLSRQMCMFLVLVSLVLLVSEASRFPQVHWEQMLPKKLPLTFSSSPSKGTNSISKSSSTSSLNTNSIQISVSSDGKV
uniref:Uncharacterized protein n=1 Tax=Noccaea caerulescens TaxID=107243 RepID=A0A1J3CLW3_NOCCA